MALGDLRKSGSDGGATDPRRPGGDDVTEEEDLTSRKKGPCQRGPGWDPTKTTVIV